MQTKNRLERRIVNNEEIKAMLYDILETYSGFDGQIRGILKINEYIMKLKEGDEKQTSED